jgi:iron complex outermembrane receptor protein
VNGNLIVEDNYINIATQLAQGIDYNVRYTRSIGAGEFTADAEATQYRKQNQRLVPTDPVDDYNGTLRYPRWLGDLDLKYRWKSWTYYYTLSYVGKMDSNAYEGVDPATDPYNFAVGSYITHSLSVKYTGANNWSIIGGIRNLTDEAPKTISPGAYNRYGNALLYSGYDYFGRRAFVSISKTL